MKITKAYWGLIIMVAAAAVFLLFGFLVIDRNFSTPASSSTPTNTNPTPAPVAPTPTADTTGWLTYANTKYSYQLMYPPQLKAGSISDNSVLGTFQTPVKGFHVGPLVLVSLTGSLRQQGADYFNQSYQSALHPATSSAGSPAGGCTVDQINNPNATVQSVSCTGEGGAARYALITGTTYDVFVDDYSQGFDNQDNGQFTSPDDYLTILSTFKFGLDAASTTPAAPGGSTPTTPATPPPGVQSFTIIADDSGANPSEVTVPAGTIVDLTFNVTSQNVNFGGLDFRSGTVTTGTIQAGGSKTIAFTATQSMVFVPYGAADNGTRPYTVKVTVQ